MTRILTSLALALTLVSNVAFAGDWAAGVRRTVPAAPSIHTPSASQLVVGHRTVRHDSDAHALAVMASPIASPSLLASFVSTDSPRASSPTRHSTRGRSPPR